MPLTPHFGQIHQISDKRANFYNTAQASTKPTFFTFTAWMLGLSHCVKSSLVETCALFRKIKNHKISYKNCKTNIIQNLFYID